MTVFGFVIVLYTIVTLWSLVVITLNGKRSTRSLGWALTCIGMPFLGPALYYLFGINRRKFKLFQKKSLKRRETYETEIQSLKGAFSEDFASDHPQRLSQLIEHSTRLRAHNGNEVTVLWDGRQTFEVLFEEMQKAQKFIHLQYYIFEEGEVQERILKIAKAKIKQGVEVRLLYDSFGSFGFRGKIKKKFTDVGVKVYPLMPLRFGNLLYTLNFRNHRKIVVIDGHTGFIGGVNVSDKYIKKKDKLGIWQDLHLRLKGPVVRDLGYIFHEDHHFSGSPVDFPIDPTYFPKLKSPGGATVQISASGPDSKYPTILQQYMAMIMNAKKEICIANPYFIPGISLIHAMEIASLSGVVIKLLVPKKSDSFLAKYSMFSNFERLLRSGVRIFLREDFSHSKMAITDGAVASIGSGNFDHRSFEHNFEANALVYDRAIANALVEEFERCCEGAFELDFDTFCDRGNWQRLKEGFARYFSPLL